MPVNHITKLFSPSSSSPQSYQCTFYQRRKAKNADWYQGNSQFATNNSPYYESNAMSHVVIAIVGYYSDLVYS